MGETLLLFDMNPNGWNLSNDEQVRCLAYVARHIRDFAALPEGIAAHIIPIRYPARVPVFPYPVLSLYTLDGYQVDVDEIPDPFRVEEAIEAFLNQMGKDKMLALSASQTITWQNVLTRAHDADEAR